ncbi:hypothetical protein EOM82_02055 [bacterium]|nr:hypothetical protein [bacterium]
MKKALRISLSIILLAAIAIIGFACTDSEVDYSQIESIEVDNESIAEGFLVSEFDISMVKLNVTYKASVDANGKPVAGKTISIPAKESMVKAEDKAKLRVAGSNTITLIYGKFTIQFTLKLYDDTILKYKVMFLDESGNMLGDAQYVPAGGKPTQPTLPTKSGFEFIGWRDKDTNKFSTLDNILKNTTLTATYAPSFYEVAFYARTAESEIEIIKVNVPRGGNAFNYAPEIPILSGYSNGRWEDVVSMQGVDSEGLKFYAIYDRDQVKVTYIYKRNSEADEKYDVAMPANTEIKNPPPAEQGNYKFVGWYANGKKVVFPYTVTNEMTFTAKYIDIRTGNPGLQYQVTEGGYAISGYNDEDEKDYGVIVIPAKHQNVNVVGINYGVFKDYDIKEYVVNSDSEAFTTTDNVLYSKDKKMLIAYPNARIGDSYAIAAETETIGKYAFYNSKNLSIITLGDKLKLISGYAFAQCNNLTSIAITKAVQTIEERAFKILDGESYLTHITFDPSSNLLSIGEEAFYGLNRLISITLPSSLTTLQGMAFYGCKSLNSISVVNGSQSFEVKDGALYNKGCTVLYAYPAMRADAINFEFVVDARCAEIKQGAFSFAKLGGIKIGSETTSRIKINPSAIVCPNVVSITIDAAELEYTLDIFDIFYPEKIYIKRTGSPIAAAMETDFPQSAIILGQWNDGESFFSDYIYIIEEVSRIVEGALETREEATILGCRNTTENLNIPSTINSYNVTKIAPKAFYGDINIQTVNLPIDLLEIGEKAFYGAKSLKTVNAKHMLSTIGDEAFYGCTSLSDFNIDGELEITNFGTGVLNGTEWINNDEEEFLTIGNVLVKYTGLGMEAKVPEEISYIATDAFSQKSNLISVDFEGQKLKYIDYRAFQACSGLVSMVFPSSLRYIASEAFFGCTALYVVTYTNIYSNSTLTVESDAFGEDSAVYQIYRDTTLYRYSFKTDTSGNADNFDGLVIVSPYKVDNTGSSRFAGWYKDEAYTQIAEFPMYIPDAFASDIAQSRTPTLYSKWIPINKSTAGLQFELNEIGQYTVVGYVGTDEYVIVPDRYKDRAVTQIAQGAFFGKSYITQIELPNTLSMTGEYKSKITSIGEDAFSGTAWFENYRGDFVIIDDILVKYKGQAKVVSVPSNIAIIAEGAFKNNDYVEKIILASEITILSDSVFENCTQLNTVVLPEKLMQIGNSVFSGCNKLVNINFDDCELLSNIGYDAFDGTKWLSDYVDDCILINKIFYKYQGNAKSLHIINGIESISERAFYGNESLERVYIPQSVKYIGEAAFVKSIDFVGGQWVYQGTDIIEVILFAGGNNLESISSKAFYNCLLLTTLNLSLATNLTYIGDEAFFGCNSYKILSVPSSLNNLGSYSFSNSGLTTVSFVQGSMLTRISDYAFADCLSLTSVVFNGTNALIEVGNYAFKNCISLTSFRNSGSAIETISEGAFYDCEKLSNFAIDESKLTQIGNYAFEDVGAVVNVDTNMVVLGSILISYNGIDKVVNIPSQITSIYNRAFYNNANLTTINFAEDSALISINSEAFANCTNLENINFPQSIVYVGNDVMKNTKWYENNRNLEFVVIGSTLIKYNSLVVKQVIIPDNVAVINANTFDGSSVYDITIGSSVHTIADGAFDGISDGYEQWTITMLSDNPPKLLELDVLNAYMVLLNSADTVESYRLDEGWSIQYVNGKLFEKTTYEVVFDIPENTGEVIENKELYALYSEIPVNTYVSGETAYVFTGWYFDEDCSVPVIYPFMLTQDITLYAKCIDNSVGSNPAYYTVEGVTEKSILRYHYYNDTKLVIISSHASTPITSIGQSYQIDNESGEYIYEGGEYIYNPASEGEKYSYWGAFENHTELIEVYFATGSSLRVIGENAFANCTNLTKIVIPASVELIESGAFKNCTSLREIIFVEGTAPLTIEEGAFENCAALTAFTVPDRISVLEDGAFEGCVNIKDIYVYASTPINLGNNAPFEIVEGLIVHIPYGKYSTYFTSWAAYKDYLQENAQEG